MPLQVLGASELYAQRDDWGRFATHHCEILWVQWNRIKRKVRRDEWLLRKATVYGALELDHLLGVDSRTTPKWKKKLDVQIRSPVESRISNLWRNTYNLPTWVVRVYMMIHIDKPIGRIGYYVMIRFMNLASHDPLVLLSCDLANAHMTYCRRDMEAIWGPLTRISKGYSHFLPRRGYK
jgi:hypothetical protein